VCMRVLLVSRNSNGHLSSRWTNTHQQRIQTLRAVGGHNSCPCCTIAVTLWLGPPVDR
jgi:hypothetical protein